MLRERTAAYEHALKMRHLRETGKANHRFPIVLNAAMSEWGTYWPIVFVIVFLLCCCASGYGVYQRFKKNQQREREYNSAMEMQRRREQTRLKEDEPLIMTEQAQMVSQEQQQYMQQRQYELERERRAQQESISGQQQQRPYPQQTEAGVPYYPPPPYIQQQQGTYPPYLHSYPQQQQQILQQQQQPLASRGLGGFGGMAATGLGGLGVGSLLGSFMGGHHGGGGRRDYDDTEAPCATGTGEFQADTGTPMTNVDLNQSGGEGTDEVAADTGGYQDVDIGGGDREEFAAETE